VTLAELAHFFIELDPVIHVSKAVINDVTVEDMDHFRLEFVKVGFYRLLVVTFSDVEVFKLHHIEEYWDGVFPEIGLGKVDL